MGNIVLFGEIMLRLKPPGKERFFQSPQFEAVFGGSEANVAVSLALLGLKSVYVTALPDTAVGKAAAASLAYYGVQVNALWKNGRLGVYYLENGACQRPSQVIYDRDGSCFALSAGSEYDWNAIFSGADWFHVSGVTPALTQNTADAVLGAMQEAKKMGVQISLDLNYRKKLWKYGKSASDVMRTLAGAADVLIANEEDVQNCLGIPLKNFGTPTECYRHLCADVLTQFPNARLAAVTLRQSYSADRNGWSAILATRSAFYESVHYDIENIVERVGAGDSFAAGLIYGLSEFKNEQKALDFAAAASCLKHSVAGDFNIVTKAEIENLMNGSTNGRIQR